MADNIPDELEGKPEFNRMISPQEVEAVRRAMRAAKNNSNDKDLQQAVSDLYVAPDGTEKDTYELMSLYEARYEGMMRRVNTQGTVTDKETINNVLDELFAYPIEQDPCEDPCVRAAQNTLDHSRQVPLLPFPSFTAKPKGGGNGLA